MRPLTSAFSSSDSLSSRSFSSRSPWYTSASASLRDSVAVRRARSSSACSAASRTIWSTSSLASIDEAVIATFCSLFVALSLAVTLRMPLASMSKVTSICGTPRGAGGMPSSRNVASFLLSAAISRSPWSTTMSTDGWLSDAVEKIWVCDVGIVVLRLIIFVATPPIVSMPSDSGVTSRSSTSFTSPPRTPAWIAAPTATTSSGLTPLCGSLPLNCFLTASTTAGMRVMPPTRITSSISAGFMLASASAFFTGSDVAVDEVGDEILELCPGQRHDQVLRPGRIGADERQVDLGRCRARQLDLRLLRGLLQPLERDAVLAQVDPFGLLELLAQPVDDALVEVVAAEVGVAVGGAHLEHALGQLEDADVEGAAAQVVDGDLLVLLAVEAVGQRRRGRLVDDALDVEAGDATRVLRRLSLGVVEVGRDGDDRLGHLLAEVGLGVALQLLQDHRADLGRAEGLPVPELHDDAVGLRVLDHLVRDEVLAALHLGVVPAATHEALDAEDRVLGVGDGLALRHLAHQPLPVLGEGDDRWCDAGALRVGDDLRLAALHGGDDGVRRAQVDADDLAHRLVNAPSGCSRRGRGSAG